MEEKWWFGNDEQAAFKYIMKDIRRKWKDHRLILWNKHYDITRPRDVNVRNPPKDISADDWAMFIDYRLNPKTKVGFFAFYTIISLLIANVFVIF